MSDRPTPLPPNRRRAPPADGAPPRPKAAAARPQAAAARPQADAARPQADDSPAPPATSVSVRPPRAPRASRAAAPAAPAAPRPARRFLRSIQLVAGVAVVLAASIGVAWGARRYILSSPRFAVRTVLVDGAARRSADQIAGAGGIAVGANIFALDLALAGAAIATDPWIERASVTRKLPGTVHVTVVEREARAIAAVGGELYLATRDGDLFKKVGEDDPVDLPIVTGVTPEQVARDRAGAVLAVKRALDVVDDFERAGISRRYPLQEIHLEKDGSIVFTIGKEGIALHLGQAPYREKVAQASRVLSEISRRKANAAVIFLDNDAHPERVIVRMR